MFKKIMLLTAVSAVIAAAGAPSAQAAYLGVFVTYTPTLICQPAPDQVVALLAFKAKVTATGTTKPSKIRIGYQVVNRQTKAVRRSGVLNLKRSKGYKASTPTFQAAVGEPLAVHANMSYKAYGKTRKKKISDDLDVPDLATLQSYGIPACQPVG